MADIASAIDQAPYHADVAEGVRREDVFALIESLPALRDRPGNEHVHGLRSQSFRVPFRRGDAPVEAHLKLFRRQSVAKDACDRSQGSRARRSWSIARALVERGIGTPEPLAFFERWEGLRLIESGLLTVHQEAASTFRDELIRLYAADPVCSRIMALLEAVARAVRGLHDAGVYHRDLGNQNILVTRAGEAEWTNVQFIDLNRSRLFPSLAVWQRAADVSRLTLPSDFLRVFKEMYFGEPVPSAFQRWERFFRTQFAWHTRTRRFRRPFRSMMESRSETGVPASPREQDLWIWDDRSAQPVSPMTARDRRRYHSSWSHAATAAITVRRATPVWRRYRVLLAGAFQRPVDMSRRVGIAVSPTPDTLDRELGLLRRLGKVPVLMRICRHEGAANWDFGIEVVLHLHRQGYPVTVALVQDRQSVIEPARWVTFLRHVLPGIRDAVDGVEIGHAINRSKWGFWTLREYRRFMGATAPVLKEFPGVRFMGPAAIDFEYPAVLAALAQWPPSLRFHAMSHLLYTDRRGAPENAQGRFSALEKFALARAIAEATPATGGRLVVSEVNWPLQGTGVYSPVGAPYVSPGPRFNDPSVSEDLAADYMIRYLLLALCSGLVERVYWWRLVARGFGLVDDSVPTEWRLRPGYTAMETFLSIVGAARFLERIQAPNGVGLYRFDSAAGRRMTIGYSSDSATPSAPPFAFREAMDRSGNRIEKPVATLTGSPVYFMDPD